jgi:thiamine biosynthesis lipoprotein ApbE
VADAAATAVFVMGAEEGQTWIESQPGLEALFLVREDDGTFAKTQSSGFSARTLYDAAEAGRAPGD